MPKGGEGGGGDCTRVARRQPPKCETMFVGVYCGALLPQNRRFKKETFRQIGPSEVVCAQCGGCASARLFCFATSQVVTSVPAGDFGMWEDEDFTPEVLPAPYFAAAPLAQVVRGPPTHQDLPDAWWRGSRNLFLPPSFPRCCSWSFPSLACTWASDGLS